MYLTKLCFIKIVTVVFGLTPIPVGRSKSSRVNAMVAPAVEKPPASSQFLFHVVPDADVEVPAVLEHYNYKPYRYLEIQPNGPTFVLASGNAETWSDLWAPDETNSDDEEVLQCHVGAGELLYEMYSGTHIQPTDEHILVADLLWDIDHEHILDRMRKLSKMRNTFSPALERDIIACLFVSRESNEDGPNLASASALIDYAKKTGVIVFRGKFLGMIVQLAEYKKIHEKALADKERAEQLTADLRANKAKAEQLAGKLHADKEMAEQLAGKLHADKEIIEEGLAKTLANKEKAEQEAEDFYAELLKLIDRINVLEKKKLLADLEKTEQKAEYMYAKCQKLKDRINVLEEDG